MNGLIRGGDGGGEGADSVSTMMMMISSTAKYDAGLSAILQHELPNHHSPVIAISILGVALNRGRKVSVCAITHGSRLTFQNHELHERFTQRRQTSS